MNNNITNNFSEHSESDNYGFSLILTDENKFVGYTCCNSKDNNVQIYLSEGASVVNGEDETDFIVFDNEIIGCIWVDEEETNIDLFDNAYFVSLNV